MKKTGIYSGSFNPIHIGHLALANWLCEFTEIDELWFLVTPQNPLKQKSDLIDDQQRLERVRSAITGYEKFRLSDIEFHLPRPSYTIDTLRALEQQHPDRRFYFIIGADNWCTINRWKEHEQLLHNYPILIYPRKGYEVRIPDHYPHIRLVDAPEIEISSTFIRNAWREGKDVRFFLPSTIK
ncbi:nicotinate-nucleotide adenylyltransferase [Parabacteroides sp. OttesenSCG-928-N08]|nr:nicotinate-nucleotide adenylyltransferase [Parabacteroides sp. OttesenSCG-928-N08]